MITEQHQKEGISRAYALAVGSCAGMNCQIGFSFDYKVDGCYREVDYHPDGEMNDSGFQIDFQLKASKNVVVEEQEVIYDLDVRNFKHLIKGNRGIPKILVLLKLPADKNDWITICEDYTKLRNCAWYCSLVGEEPTKNTSKRRIRIPRSQILTPESLKLLMESVKRGELL